MPLPDAGEWRVTSDPLSSDAVAPYAMNDVAAIAPSAASHL